MLVRRGICWITQFVGYRYCTYHHSYRGCICFRYVVRNNRCVRTNRQTIVDCPVLSQQDHVSELQHGQKKKLACESANG